MLFDSYVRGASRNPRVLCADLRAANPRPPGIRTNLRGWNEQHSLVPGRAPNVRVRRDVHARMRTSGQPSPAGRGQGEGSNVTFALAVIGAGARSSKVHNVSRRAFERM